MIIGITAGRGPTGGINAGKDTAANFIQEVTTKFATGYGKFEGNKWIPMRAASDNETYLHKRLADRAKEMYAELVGINIQDLHLRDTKEQHRAGFIKFAEGMKELIGDDVWIDRLLRKTPSDQNIVISDIRFEVEAKKTHVILNLGDSPAFPYKEIMVSRGTSIEEMQENILSALETLGIKTYTV